MKKINRVLGLFCVLALMAALFTGLSRQEKASAAEGNTVRVATQKELKKALKDSSIETIILRTNTYDSITISSKKAKNKKLIVDAYNSKITNKAKFKSITLISADHYIEDVSGNTITAQTTAFEIAENRTVKKLILNCLGTDYVVRKGASIKNLVYRFGGKNSSYDKSSHTLKFKANVFDYETFDCKEVSYKLVTDEAGRVTYLEYKEPSSKRSLKTDIEYDENGNILKTKEVYADNGKVNLSYEYKYDNYNNRIYEYADHGYYTEEINTEYDSEGRRISYTSLHSDGNTSKSEYTYDSKGRKIKSVYTYSRENIILSGDTTTYTYNKKGYRTKVVTEHLDGYKGIEVDKYDSAGNYYYGIQDEYFEDGTVNRYKYKYVYDEYGEMLTGYILYPNSKEWLDMSELGD